MMKIAIIGGTESALRLCKLLVSERKTPAVWVLQPPDPHEDQKSYKESVHFIEQYKIPFVEARKFTSQVFELLKKENVQVGCLINCRFLVPEEYLNCLEFGFLAAHGSLLPQYRGFAPLNWSIINQLDEVGITIFRAAKDVDSGGVLLTKKFSIDSKTLASEIFQTFSINQPVMFLEVLKNLGTVKASSQIDIKNQDETMASYCCQRTPLDSEISWKASANQVAALVRASQPPYPYAYSFYKGELIQFVRTEVLERRKNYVGIIPGRVCEISSKEGWVDILCGDGPLRVYSVIIRGELKNAAVVIKSLKQTLGLNYTQEVLKLKEEVETLKSIVSSLKVQ